MANEYEANESGTEPAINTTTDPNTITKAVADGYVDAWMSGKYSLVPSSEKPGAGDVLALDSFLFSIDDFKDFVARVDLHNQHAPESEQITGVICRVGIKPSPTDKKSVFPVPGLFFQPNVGFKTDPLDAGTSIGEMVPVGGSPQGLMTSARYDFSYPCPPTCSGGQVG